MFNDCDHGVQSFPVGVERVIPDGRGVFLVDDLQYPARFILAAIDVDLNFGAVAVISRHSGVLTISGSGMAFSADMMDRPSKV